MVTTSPEYRSYGSADDSSGGQNDREAAPWTTPTPAGAHLRASDSDRDQVATVLSTAYAEGRLTRDEHDERLDAVMRARTFAELIPLTEDLVPSVSAATTDPARSALPARPDDAPWQIDTTDASNDADTLIGIFGGATRKGKWRVRRQIRSFALFGGVDLDMREATFEGHTVEIEGFWCFGGLDIKVPAGVQVRDQTAGIFGGTDITHLGDPVPGAPTLVIKGVSLFGGVSIRGPKPSRRRRGDR